MAHPPCLRASGKDKFSPTLRLPVLAPQRKSITSRTSSHSKECDKSEPGTDSRGGRSLFWVVPLPLLVPGLSWRLHEGQGWGYQCRGPSPHPLFRALSPESQVPHEFSLLPRPKPHSRSTAPLSGIGGKAISLKKYIPKQEFE